MIGNPEPSLTSCVRKVERADRRLFHKEDEGVLQATGKQNLWNTCTELYNRVDTNDPANSALIILILATAGIESDATLRDVDTVSALVAGTTNEVTNSGYARKTLTDTDLTAFAPDDTNDRVDLDIADQTWTSVAAGDGWNDLVNDGPLAA